VRDKEGVRAVVLAGAPAGGGAALVAAARKDSGLDAGALAGGAFGLIQGGGRRDAQFTFAGGKDPSRLDEALSVARAAAGA
jgi:hypothetical protein